MLEEEAACERLLLWIVEAGLPCKKILRLAVIKTLEGSPESSTGDTLFTQYIDLLQEFKACFSDWT